MGRRKICIKAIGDKKIKYSTFNKRKNGLVKKAAELSMLCDVKMLLAFEDLNGDIVRYSTHGIYEPDEYFKEAWLQCERSFTAKDYPDFFKVKQYKKVLERREKRKIKAEEEESAVKPPPTGASDESEEEYQRVPLRESRTVREKTVYKSKRKRSTTSLKLRIPVKDVTGQSEDAPKDPVPPVKQEKSKKAQVSKATSDKTTTEDTTHEHEFSEDRVKVEANDNLLRTPQILGFPDPKTGELASRSPNMLNLGNPELDMRSPNLAFLNEQFLKPQLGSQKLHHLRDDIGQSPMMTANFLNDSHDNNMGHQAAAHLRKNSFESYFHLLAKESNDIDAWRKNESINGYKLTSPQFQAAEGIGNFINFSSGGNNFSNQRDFPMFMLDDSFKDDTKYEGGILDFPDLRGAEPTKKVKKE